jgi:GNAT superfamily N-acetyltransferase
LFQIRQIGIDEIDVYERIPMRFTVDSYFDVSLQNGGLDGFRITERRVRDPWVKDYLAQGHTALPGWIDHFDGAGWAYFLAEDGDEPVGGAAIASRTPSMYMLDGRDDLAVLVDIRVHPMRQRSGVATALVALAIKWARDEGLSQLKIETQNINVPGCRFYASLGCELRGVQSYAYASDTALKDEIMFLWWLDL